MVIQGVTEAKRPAIEVKGEGILSFIPLCPDPMTSATATGLVSCGLKPPDVGDSDCC